MKKPILIEIVVWSAILAIVFTVVIFAYSKLFVEPNIYTIEFKDIDGITKGSPVRFMGMNVGYVRNLTSKPKHIDVQIIVTRKDMKIPNGTVARVEFYGLGGSKSIELMPPDGSCDVGILTDYTIRINDVVQEATGLVDIIEEIEKYVKGLDKAGMQRFLKVVKDVKDDKLIETQGNFHQMQNNISKKSKEIQNKEISAQEKIKQTEENIDKINKFIKK